MIERCEWCNGRRIGVTDDLDFDELARLRAENERLKADAARYEWLRRQHWSDASMCVVMKPRSAVRLGHDCPAVDRLDAAIDAAMAQGDKA